MFQRSHHRCLDAASLAIIHGFVANPDGDGRDNPPTDRLAWSREVCADLVHRSESEPAVRAFVGQHRYLLYDEMIPTTPATPAAAAAVSASTLASPRPEIRVRHLLYHVYPSPGNDVWRRNVRQLRRRLQQFNGRRLVAVATGPGLASLNDVRAAFGNDAETIQFVPVENDPLLTSDAAGFAALLRMDYDRDPTAATFYAHTKGAGNAVANPLAIEYWRNALYASLLDNPGRVADALRTHAAVGGCKILSPVGEQQQWPSRLKYGDWHYSGTFFWFRHDAIFGSPRWPFVPYDRYGSEAWLGGILPADEAATLYQPWPEDSPSPPSPYSPATHTLRIRDEPPSVSVITTCKGRLSHLRTSLPLWLRQEAADAPGILAVPEIIVVDYDCPDGTAAWLAEHHPEVRCVAMPQGKHPGFNVSHARNCGAAAAQGDWLLFADADILPGPDLVEQMVRIAGGDPRRMVCAGHYEQDADGSPILRTTSTTLIAAETFHRVRGFDEGITGYGWEDVDLTNRCRAAGVELRHYYGVHCIPHDDELRMRFHGGGGENEKRRDVETGAAWVRDAGRAINEGGYGRVTPTPTPTLTPTNAARNPVVIPPPGV